MIKVLNKLDKLSLKWKVFGTFILMFLFMFSQIFQGLNYLDTAFYLTHYENLFSHPQFVNEGFSFYLTNVIGSLFVRYFPGPEIFGLRLLRILNDLCVAFIVFLMLRKYVNVNILLFGLLITTFTYIQRPLEFYYDSLSVLILITGAYLLFYGIVRDKNHFIFFSGFVIFLNTLARIPNILDFGLIAILLFYPVIFKVSFKRFLKKSLYFLSGFLLCSGLFVIYLILSENKEFFVNNFIDLKQHSQSDSVESHGITTLIVANAKDYYGVLIWGLRYLSYFFILVLIGLIKNKVIRFFLFLLVTVLLCVFFLNSSFPTSYFAYFVSLIVLPFQIFNKKLDVNLRLLSAIALFTLLVLPLGSNFPLLCLGNYAIYLSFPLSLFFILDFLRNSLKSVKVKLISNSFTQIEGRSIASVFIMTLFVFVFSLFIKSITLPDFIGGTPKYLNNAKIHSNKAKFILVNQVIANRINPVIEGVKPLIKRGIPIIVSDFPILINFLDGIPYNFTSFYWMEEEYLKNRLEMTYKRTSVLPAFLVDKNDSYFNTHKKIIFEFLNSHANIEKIWQNDDYILFLPVDSDYKK